MGRHIPIVQETPHEVPDLSLSKAPGRELSYFGYRFEVPWNDVDEARTSARNETAIIFFQSGLTVIFKIVPPHALVDAVLSAGKINRDRFRQVYGDDALKSDYLLTRLMLQSVPGKITPFTPRNKVITDFVLLLLKGMSTPTDSGIYSVRTKRFNGFQYGNPLRRAKKYVTVDLFTNDCGLEFLFLQAAKPDQKSSATISQSDINRVIQTLQRVPQDNLAYQQK